MLEHHIYASFPPVATYSEATPILSIRAGHSITRLPEWICFDSIIPGTGCKSAAMTLEVTVNAEKNQYAPENKPQVYVHTLRYESQYTHDHLQKSPAG